MTCDHCGERDAEITLTEIENDEMRTLHLCSSCAIAKGVESSSPPEPPLADFLASLGGEGSGAAALSGATEACPYCGTTAKDFRRIGRLGCPQCYAHFQPQLRGLLRRVHGASQHMGKVYVSAATDLDDREIRIATLKRRLERAVEVEDFESAARLRDQIHDLTAVE